MLKMGTILRGIYRIDSYLSSGGFGNTYVATNIEFDERVAIKEFFMKGVTQRDDNKTTVSVSNSENTNSFLEQKEKFKKEARRIRQLKNEHIVSVHDLFEENGTAYYVMDFVDGENLAEQLKRTGMPMTEQEVRKLLPQILDALKSVHDAGIWHLDLKPANIMVDKTGKVKLIDFGASKQLNTQKGGATTSTAISYTNGYAPREQMEQNYDKFGPWTDIYALGATLYNLLTNNQPPLPTDIDDDVSEDKHKALPFPDSVRAETKSMVIAMLNTNRLQRPQTIDAIVDVIKSNKATPQQQVNPKKSPKENNYRSNEETIIDKPKRTIEREKPESKLQNAQEHCVKHQSTSQQPTSHDGKSGKDGNSENGASGCVVFSVLAVGILLVMALINALSDKSIDNDNEIVEHVEFVEETVKNGFFEESYDDGSSYKGNFKDGLYHGQGTYIWANGQKYEGKWNKGNMVKGTYTWPEKRKDYMYKYVGEFKNNKREGEGTAYYVGGETRSGLWKNGEFVESQHTSIADINDESQPTSIPDINDFSTSKVCYEQAKKLRLNGLGEKAIEFYLKANRIGERPYRDWALYQIGCIYYLGLSGVKTNYYEAFKYFKMASDSGVLQANYYLGQCYEFGHGVQKDIYKAKVYKEKSGYHSPPGYDF